MVELVVHEVEDEERVDDPDAGGEVRSAVVHEREAPGARAVADLAGDAQLQRVSGARAVSASSSLSSVSGSQPSSWAASARAS
jgi:hypothetical protein